MLLFWRFAEFQQFGDFVNEIRESETEVEKCLRISERRTTTHAPLSELNKLTQTPSILINHCVFNNWSVFARNGALMKLHHLVLGSANYWDDYGVKFDFIFQINCLYFLLTVLTTKGTQYCYTFCVSYRCIVLM